MKKLPQLLLFIIPISIFGQTAKEYYEQGKKLVTTSNYEDAIPALTRSISLDSNNKDAFKQRGIARMNTRDFEGALADFRRTLTYSGDISVHYMRAEIYKKQQKWVEAIEDYSKILSIDHQQFNAFRYGIEVYTINGSYPNAEELLELFNEYNPHQTYQSYILRGDYFSFKGEHHKALAEYDKGIMEFPNFNLAYRGKGRTYLMMNDFKQAVNYLNQAISKGDNTPEAFTFRAIAKGRSGDIEEARLDYDKAIGIDRNFVDAYFHRATFKALSGDFAGGLLDINEALDINPNLTPAFSTRGIIYFHLEQFENVIKDFEKFIQLVPNSAEAYTYLGKATINLGKNQESLKYIDKAIELGPDMPEPYMVRGYLKISSQEYPQALKDLNRSIQLAPDFPAALYHRGTAHIKLDLKNEACADYNKALNLGVAEAKDELSKIGCNKS